MYNYNSKATLKIKEEKLIFRKSDITFQTLTKLEK